MRHLATPHRCVGPCSMLESVVDSYVELPVLGGVQRIRKVVEQLLDLVWTKKLDEKNREMVYFPMMKKT